MATSKKNEPVESKAVTPEELQQVETLQEEAQQDTISDRKLILAPLVKYGAVAFVLAGIIVTTAVMLNSDNDIDKQVAALETEITLQKPTEQLTEQEVIKITEITTPATETLASNDETTTVAIAPEVIQPVATAPVMSAPVTTPTKIAFKAFDPKARMAEHHEFMAKQDQKYLESFKNNQSRQIERLRKQLVQQQERIDAIEKRNMETYEMRETSIKRMQEAREQSLNRI